MKGYMKRNREHKLPSHGHVRYNGPRSVEESQFEKKEIVTQLLVSFLVQRDLFTLIATTFLNMIHQPKEHE